MSRSIGLVDPAFASPPGHRGRAGRLTALPVGDRVRSSLPEAGKLSASM